MSISTTAVYRFTSQRCGSTECFRQPDRRSRGIEVLPWRQTRALLPIPLPTSDRRTFRSAPARPVPYSLSPPVPKPLPPTLTSTASNGQRFPGLTLRLERGSGPVRNHPIPTSSPSPTNGRFRDAADGDDAGGIFRADGVVKFDCKTSDSWNRHLDGFREKAGCDWR